MTHHHSEAPTHTERTFFGHPWGLANLFGIEMWERFSFYGMQALLAFYIYHPLTQGGLNMDKATATSIVGAYGGMVYLSALLASFVGDRLIGSERTLFYSAISVMIGHISLALVPGATGLAIGLVGIALGSGGIKTSAQVVLGQLYSREDTRRDAGFSIFYLGINIGALAGPILTNILWGWGGFHWGFGIAAAGMALGLIQYILMRQSTIGAAGHEIPNPLPRSSYVKGGIIAAIVVVLAVTLVATGIIPLNQLSNVVTAIALISAVTMWCQMYFSDLTTPEERSRLIGFIPMFISCVLFFGIFKQQFTVLAIYSDVRLDRTIGSYEMKPGLINAINPVFIIIFSIIFATMWTKLGDRQWSTPVKFGVANLIIGVSLFFFLPFSGAAASSVPIYPIVWILFLFTMAELLLSPVGNSLATKLAPHAFPSKMFALWLMAVATGSALAGTVAKLYNPDDAASENAFFLTLGAISVVVGLVLLVSKRWVLKHFQGIR